MKYKVGDRVRMKNEEWFEDHSFECEDGIMTDESVFITYEEYSDWHRCCNQVATITAQHGDYYLIDIDNGQFKWHESMILFKIGDNVHNDLIYPELIEDIGKLLSEKHSDLIVRQSDNRIIIDSTYSFDDLPAGTPVMVRDESWPKWSRKIYAGHKKVFVSDDKRNKSAVYYDYVIPVDKFDKDDMDKTYRNNIMIM